MLGFHHIYKSKEKGFTEVNEVAVLASVVDTLFVNGYG